VNQIDLRGRFAIVTGGGSGLGHAIAMRLHQSGARVAVWDIHLAGAPQTPTEFLSISADVSDFTSLQTALSKTRDSYPRIDILINNAGITGPNANTWDYSIADWKKVTSVNLDGVFYCSKLIIPVMREQNYGRIVNIASVAGKDGNPNAPAYSASKAAVIALTKSLGKELADTAIRVNCVTPAAVRTPLFSQMTEEHIAFMLSKIPMGRFGTPEEVAAMVAWLCSEECSFSTGATFDISGGRSTY
jgi:2-dehydro-3-deoxy-L-rhamnonate dehydrogenase (NAD+)